MKSIFAAFFTPASAWRDGKTSREQPYWSEHATFMDQLFEEGIVVLGGPYADYTSLLVIVEALKKEAVHTLFGQDPFVIHKVVDISSVHEWLIFLDARQKLSSVGGSNTEA